MGSNLLKLEQFGKPCKRRRRERRQEEEKPGESIVDVQDLSALDHRDDDQECTSHSAREGTKADRLPARFVLTVEVWLECLSFAAFVSRPTNVEEMATKEKAFPFEQGVFFSCL